jgi:L-aminopeptidase/D-esterase-like protein
MIQLVHHAIQQLNASHVSGTSETARLVNHPHFFSTTYATPRVQTATSLISHLETAHLATLPAHCAQATFQAIAKPVLLVSSWQAPLARHHALLVNMEIQQLTLA